MKVAGKPLQVAAVDPLTVIVTFPVAFAPGLVLLDNMPILPKHKLQASLDAGTFGSAWGVGTPVGEIAGLGPFVLAEYVPGQRTVFARNPKYFRKDAAGAPLPYLDRVIVEVVPDQTRSCCSSTPAARQTGSGAVGSLRAAEARGRRRVRLRSTWGRLRPGRFLDRPSAGAFAKDPRAGWMQRDELRRRRGGSIAGFCGPGTGRRGAGFGPITRQQEVYSPDLPRVTCENAAGLNQRRTITATACSTIRTTSPRASCC
jgi:hypothetical protein